MVRCARTQNKLMKCLLVEESNTKRVIALLCAFMTVNVVFFIQRMRSPTFQYGKVSFRATLVKKGAIDPGGGYVSERYRALQSFETQSDVHETNPIVNPHDYNFTINEPFKCNNTDTTLVIIVCSGVTNFEERLTIRQTWGSYVKNPKLHSKLVFLVGATKDMHNQKRLEEESKKYHDMIQEDFLDTYRNLSIKSVAMLKWTSHFCDNSRYLLKTDDDMFINIPNLVKSLKQQKHSRFIMGSMIVGAKPAHNRVSKWYTTQQEYPHATYPRYMSGTAYAMTTNIVKELYGVSLRTKSFWLEDIFITGLCARKIKLKHIPSGKFTYEKREVSGCAYRDSISGHRVSVNEMKTIFRELNSTKLTC